jgi:hypothetical protein
VTDRPIWMRHVGLYRAEHEGPGRAKAFALAKLYPDGLWMVRRLIVDTGRLTWLNGGSMNMGSTRSSDVRREIGPAWSMSDAALYTMATASAIALTLDEDYPELSVVRLL